MTAKRDEKQHHRNPPETVKREPPPLLHLEYYGISDIGLVRQNNEDVWAVIPEKNFYLLADGMGGHKAGEVAAKEVANSLSCAIEQMPPDLSIEQTEDYLKEAICTANQHIYTLASQQEQWRGMGTTFCCLLLYEHTLICAHVGDSRIYRYRKQLERLTQDHSLRQELLSKLQLETSLATKLPFKNVLTRAIGTHSHVTPDITTTSVLKGDLYLLCSDGLTDLLSDPEIEQVLQRGDSLQDTCETLIAEAKARGGHDNITILMIKIDA